MSLADKELEEIMEALYEINQDACILSKGGKFFRYDGQKLMQGTFDDEGTWEDFQ